MDPTLSKVVQGGAIVNGIFAILYAVGKWLATRLEDSKCQSDTGCFKCTSQLSHLKTIRATNETQLKHLVELQKQLKDMSRESETVISLV